MQSVGKCHKNTGSHVREDGPGAFLRPAPERARVRPAQPAPTIISVPAKTIPESTSVTKV